MMKASLSAAAALTLCLASGSAFAAGKTTATPTPTPPPPSPWTAPASSSSSSSSSATTESMTSGITGAAHMENVTYRPQGMSIGIGAGWTFPADLGTPNTVSARIRMESGLTFEPAVQVDVSSQSQKVTGGGTASATGVNLVFAGNVRKPIMGRNQVDVVGILSPFLAVQSQSGKDAGGNKTSATNFGLGTGWGLGVEYWPKTHWSISFNAINPLLSITNGSQKAGGVTTTTTGFFIGADFNPTVQLMTHIYY